MTEPTVIGSWITLFICALESYGINAEKFLEERGINCARATDPEHRISIITMGHLWEEAVRQSGDPSFGLRAGTFMTPNTLSVLGLAMWSACTIKEQLECFIRCLHLMANASQMHLEEADGCLVSVSQMYPKVNGESVISEISQDAICSALHTLRRAVYKQDFCPVKMELTRSTPTRPEDFQKLFGCPVTFGHDEIRIYIRLEDANAMILGCSSQVARATTRLLEERFDQVNHTDELIGQLRQALAVLLPQGKASMEQVASVLNTSKRTFHRKLDERGTSFRKQVEEYRREMTFRHMAQDELSLGDISFLLGFSSNSNFTRAFKRWTGRSPQEYRRNTAMAEKEN